MHRITLAVTVVAPLLFSGCHTFHDARFNNGEGANGEEILVVPFSESGKSLWYGESREGRGLVKFMREWAHENAVDPLFVESELTEEALHKVFNWPKERITTRDWVKIARTTGARYLVHGDIRHLSVSNPLSIGFYDPNALVRYRVVDLVNGQTVYSRDDWKVRMDERDTQFRLAYQSEDARKVRAAFVAYVGMKLGQEIYGFYDAH